MEVEEVYDVQIEPVEVKITADEGASLPCYQTEGSSGADIRALLTFPVTLGAGQRMLIPTGLRVEIPVGFEAQVRPRSGLALKHGVTVLNSPGTIDSDYRGEIKVLLANLSDEPFTVNSGDRIAQLVVCPVVRSRFVRVDTLDETSRGADGFGSTGV